MKKTALHQLLAIALAAIMVFTLLPMSVFAEEPASPTRTETLIISASDPETNMLDSEGWNWEPSANGGALTLRNFYLQLSESTASNYGIRFEGFTDYSQIFLKFEGSNILETQINRINYMIYTNGNLVVRGAPDATLRVIAPEEQTTPEIFMFGAENLSIESGNITANTSLGLIDKEVNIRDGYVRIEAGHIVGSDAIYTVVGTVNISGGEVYLHGGRDGIFVANNAAAAGAPLSVSITGGNVTIIADNPGDGAWGYGISAPNIYINTQGYLRVYGSDIAVFSPASINGEPRTIQVLQIGKGSTFEIAENSPYATLYVNGPGEGTSTSTVTINPADYTQVDAAIAAAAELDSKLYTNYAAVEDAIEAVVRNRLVLYQTQVDAMATAIEDAMAKLEYKAADYTAVDAAIAAAEELNADNYQNFSAVTAAINAVNRNLNITQQDIVDSYAVAIEAAVGALAYKPADYAAVDAAIAAVMALNPGDYVDFSAVTAAIGAVNRNLNITQQATVTGYATAIQAAAGQLVYKSADYTAVDAAIAAAEKLNPDDYVDFSAVTAAIGAVERDLNITQQATVDGYAGAIQNAIDALVYKPADYTAVDAAIAAAEELNPDDYLNFSAVTAAINAVGRDLNITAQAIVDGYAEMIEAAVAALVYKPADYTAVDAAIAAAIALNPENYADFSAVTAAVGSVERDKNITEQDIVDGYAKAIQDALDGLVYKPADYTAVDAAIAAAEALTPEDYVDFSAVTAAVQAVERDKNITEQAAVDGYAEAIQDALDGLIRKGDLDKDGRVTIEDIMAVCRLLARGNAGEAPAPESLAIGDMNGDGQLAIDDVMAICKLLARNA